MRGEVSTRVAPDAPARRDACAVLDLGKTHGRLLVLDAAGTLIGARRWASGSVVCDSGYAALDTGATTAQIETAFTELGAWRSRLARVIVSAHGAAVAGVADPACPDAGPAFAVPDYEWAGFDEREPDLASQIDPARETLSPLLPRGLNMGVQLAWMARHAPAALARAHTLLPYAQYWSWWLSGVAASEVSALGCHTLLWHPRGQRFSDWAIDGGWDRRFAPLRRAWEVLGPVRPALADRLGLPPDVQVHTGVHDSNACLAAYLHRWPEMALVSSGTWVVLMAPGAPLDGLVDGPGAGRDQLGNVSVQGTGVATARFMGGREAAVLCAGADPALADPMRLPELFARGLCLLPAFSNQGGPFAAQAGRLWLDGQELTLADWPSRLSAADRATAAALYTGLMTVERLHSLAARGPVVVDGPLANNPVVGLVLSALLPGRAVHCATDRVEGTALGAWRLAHWQSAASDTLAHDTQAMPVPDPALATMVRQHHRRWLDQLPTNAVAHIAPQVH